MRRGMEASAARYMAEYASLAAGAAREADLDLLDHELRFGTGRLKSRLLLLGGSSIVGV